MGRLQVDLDLGRAGYVGRGEGPWEPPTDSSDTDSHVLPISAEPSRQMAVGRDGPGREAHAHFGAWAAPRQWSRESRSPRPVPIERDAEQRRSFHRCRLLPRSWANSIPQDTCQPVAGGVFYDY